MHWTPANVQAQDSALCQETVHFQKAQLCTSSRGHMRLKLICRSADGNGIIAVKFQERPIVLQGVVKWPENTDFEVE